LCNELLYTFKYLN